MGKLCHSAVIEDIDLFQMASTSMSDTCYVFRNLIYCASAYNGGVLIMLSVTQNCQNLTHHCWCITVLGCTYMTTSLKGANTGMVQAWVANFVTPLKCMYGKYDWQVMS